MGAIGYREARAEDADALGALHVASWRETYACLLPKAAIEAQSAQARAAMWRGVLEDPSAFGGTGVFLAETQGKSIGFAACLGQRDEALQRQGFSGEFGAVYVLRHHQGGGVGRALMALMAGHLLIQRRTAAALWVLRENRAARAFYGRLGGAVVAEREEEQAGTALTEIAYGWRDIRPLLAAGAAPEP